MEKKTHIAVVPSPGFSHLIPILEFSKRLVHLHPNFHVTFIIPSLESPPSSSIAYLQTLPSNIESIFLPPINKHDLPQDSHLSIQMQLTITKSLPSLRQELMSLNSKSPLAILVADPFASEVLGFTKELNQNALSFIYFPSSASTLSYCFYLPTLHENISGEFRDAPEPIQIPGCVPLHGCDLPEPVQNRSAEHYKLALQRSESLLSVDGLLVNSFTEMEERAIRTMAQKESGYPPVYPIGPITQPGSNNDEKGSECMKWLENQPPSSVLYVSFGSGGTLSQDQINELAFGLELSGQKFLWVLRAPSDSVNAAYLGSSNTNNPLDFLPEGFLERTKEKGLVIPSWAPQIPILGHNSTGGFLSHCGWNSTLESTQNGVPLIAWPLFAEQKMNAVMLTDDLKVALRPKVNENGIVEREEVAKVVRTLMEGEEGKEMQKRMKELSHASINALKEDGSSTKALSQVALRWKNI
ncbi:hypothetical protein K1719_016222 [Acacia pycnantha]|nr:hypothetical protein K1719_016222 [Acacia pycnantha]